MARICLQSPGPGCATLGWKAAVCPQVLVMGLCPVRLAWWARGSSQKGTAQLQPQTGVHVLLAILRSCSGAGCCPLAPRVPLPHYSGPVARRCHTKQRWLACLQAWRTLQPLWLCEEPNSLIRTGRLGPRPPRPDQA